MDSFFIRFKNPLTLIAILVVQVIALAIQVPRQAETSPGGRPDGKKVTLLRYWATSTVTPFERLTHGIDFSLRHAWSSYVDLRHTREQDTELKQEIARLRQEQAADAEDAAQGRRLQALLQFKQQYIAATVAAQVIGSSASDRSRVLTLDKGLADGLKPDQAVITPDGIVGKLRDVWPHSAQLLLINDVNSGAGVILASSRIRGIVRGSASGQVIIDNLLADSRIKPGEDILTSGGDGIFPRGLPVGKVVSVINDPNHQPYTLITIKPNANLAQLEEVLVVTATQDTLPTAAQADAAQAQIDAAANKRAADVVAERLPSIKDLNSTTGTTGASGATGTNGITDDNNRGGMPGIPNSGLPKIVPVNHPDRYSPNAAPPATDLTPGAPANQSPPPPN